MWGLQPRRIERWKQPVKDGRGEGQKETEPLRASWSSPINLALPAAGFLLYDWEINSPFNLLLFGVLCHFKLNLILTGLLVNYRNASSCSGEGNGNPLLYSCLGKESKKVGCNWACRHTCRGQIGRKEARNVSPHSVSGSTSSSCCIAPVTPSYTKQLFPFWFYILNVVPPCSWLLGGPAFC